ncbi:MAG: shikimate kinase [Chloroflexota bacterium]
MNGKPSAIILVGFSTTGKTQVGSRVARLLGWEYVDTDAEIESMAGKPIPKIFAQDGEPVFREMERKALLAACQREKVVIATGGGAVLDPANRELMSRRGMVVCLDAEPGTIYQRLRRDADNPVLPVIRPLLNVPDPLGRIQELKASREPFYSFAHFIIKTDNLVVEAASEEVVRRWSAGGGGKGERC